MQMHGLQENRRSSCPERGQEKEESKNAFVGEWALPGGFLKMLPDEKGPEDETIKHTAARELKEETGLSLELDTLDSISAVSNLSAKSVSTNAFNASKEPILGIFVLSASLPV